VTSTTVRATPLRQWNSGWGECSTARRPVGAVMPVFRISLAGVKRCTRRQSRRWGMVALDGGARALHRCSVPSPTQTRHGRASRWIRPSRFSQKRNLPKKDQVILKKKGALAHGAGKRGPQDGDTRESAEVPPRSFRGYCGLNGERTKSMVCGQLPSPEEKVQVSRLSLPEDVVQFDSVRQRLSRSAPPIFRQLRFATTSCRQSLATKYRRLVESRMPQRENRDAGLFHHPLLPLIRI
jgi:hypothetical protein